MSVADQSTVEYREIKGYPGYRVGNDGSVWSLWVKTHPKSVIGNRSAIGNSWKKLTPVKIHHGYLLIRLRPEYKTKYVHRLVLEAFIGPCPKGMQGCHNDGDTSNNKVSNLRWDTVKGNIADKKAHGTQTSGEDHPSAKLTEEQVKRFLEEYRTPADNARFAKEFGVGRTTMRSIIRGDIWSHLPRRRTVP